MPKRGDRGHKKRNPNPNPNLSFQHRQTLWLSKKGSRVTHLFGVRQNGKPFRFTKKEKLIRKKYQGNLLINHQSRCVSPLKGNSPSRHKTREHSLR